MKNASVTLSVPEAAEAERAYLILEKTTDGTTWIEESKIEVESGAPAYDISFGPGQRVRIEHAPGYEVVYDAKQSAAVYKKKAPLTPAGGSEVSSLVPSSLAMDAPDTEMAVVGAGFTAESVIVFNGGDEPTTFVDATRLTTIVKPSLASGPVMVPVAVRTGELMSAALPFEFTAAGGATRSGEDDDDEPYSPSRKHSTTRHRK